MWVPKRLKLSPFLLAAIFQFIPFELAYSDADGEELQQILEEVKSGEILTLERVLQKVRENYSGEIIDVELEREDGLIIYEIKLITSAGRLVEIYLDARTGEIIQVNNES